jgi:hypothetical protein
MSHSQHLSLISTSIAYDTSPYITRRLVQKVSSLSFFYHKRVSDVGNLNRILVCKSGVSHAAKLQYTTAM